MATLKAELRDILTKYGINPPDPEACWIWPRAKDTHGYGQVSIDGRRRLAHRLIYAAAFGVDPTGFVVMHKCDVPACVNPRHLVLGTQRDNIADRVAKGRNGAAYGALASTAKLTADTVSDLRYDRETGRSLSFLAQKYGISKSQVSRIVNSLNWRV